MLSSCRLTCQVPTQESGSLSGGERDACSAAAVDVAGGCTIALAAAVSTAARREGPLIKSRFANCSCLQVLELNMPSPFTSPFTSNPSYSNTSPFTSNPSHSNTQSTYFTYSTYFTSHTFTSIQCAICRHLLPLAASLPVHRASPALHRQRARSKALTDNALARAAAVLSGTPPPPPPLTRPSRREFPDPARCRVL